MPVIGVDLDARGTPPLADLAQERVVRARSGEKDRADVCNLHGVILVGILSNLMDFCLLSTGVYKSVAS